MTTILNTRWLTIGIKHKRFGWSYGRLTEGGLTTLCFGPFIVEIVHRSNGR